MFSLSASPEESENAMAENENKGICGTCQCFLPLFRNDDCFRCWAYEHE